MNSRMKTVLLTTLLFCLLSLACQAKEKTQIKVLRVGSSSFPYMLIENTRAIVEASGKYELVCAKEDGTGYTRLDQFISQPGLFEQWCREQVPKIRTGSEYEQHAAKNIVIHGCCPRSGASDPALSVLTGVHRIIRPSPRQKLFRFAP